MTQWRCFLAVTICLLFPSNSRQSGDKDGTMSIRMDQLEDIVKRQQAIIDRLSITLSDKVAEISDLRKRITQLEESPGKPLEDNNMTLPAQIPEGKLVVTSRAANTHVAFFARMDHGQVDHIDAGEHIIFEVAILNIGGCFQAHTGEFTAPVNGVYQFAASVSSRRSSYPYEVLAEVVHNGYTMGKAFAQGDDHWYKDQGSVTVVIQLLQGDKVWVRHAEYSDATVFGSGFSSFTGFMLWAQ